MTQFWLSVLSLKKTKRLSGYVGYDLHGMCS